MKTCTVCHQILDESFFAKRGGKFRSSCKRCMNAYYLKWKNDNPENAKSRWAAASARYYAKDPALRNLSQRSKKAGISPEEVVLLLNKQNYCCKICGNKEDGSPKGRLHIDHCHKSLKVRGLLCGKCNTGLGLFKDDSDLMKRAIEYLLENLP